MKIDPQVQLTELRQLLFNAELRSTDILVRMGAINRLRVNAILAGSSDYRKELKAILDECGSNEREIDVLNRKIAETEAAIDHGRVSELTAQGHAEIEHALNPFDARRFYGH